MRLRSRVAVAGVLIAGTLAASGGVVSAFDDTVPWAQRPVTVGTGFVLGNGPAAGRPAVSQSGQWVAFASAASNLVPGDTNDQVDLFLRDRFHDVTTRIVENVDTAMAMSSNGRYIAFSAPGDLLTNGTGTTRDGIWDTKTSTFIAAPGVTAINNDGWFTTTDVHITADVSNYFLGAVSVRQMFKLDADGTITGPFDIHRPRIGTNSALRIGDPSLRYAVYAATLPAGSAFDMPLTGDWFPVRVDMVTGEERSILDAGIAPASHPVGTNEGPEMSPNGRYITFLDSTNARPERRFWDTQTNAFVNNIPLWEGIPTNDGRLVGREDGSIVISDPFANARSRVTIAPFDDQATRDIPTLHGLATDPNRLLACTTDPYSRFDTNNNRDCYLVPIPPRK